MLLLDTVINMSYHVLMDKETEERALRALEQKNKAQARRNAWERANRERIVVLCPIGYKDRIAAAGVESVSAYVLRLIDEDLERREASSKQVERVQTVQPVEDVPIDWGEDGPAFV